MFFTYIWIMAAVVVANLALSIVIIFKMHKQEQFQTGEAHANLELINQSLNRLSDIAEKLENIEQSAPVVEQKVYTRDRNNGQNKEQKAITMIRQGEDPRKIGRLLGISKSEIELLIASEKLGNTRFSKSAKAHA